MFRLVIKDIEIWRDIPGYDGLYQVSSFGRVKSLERCCKGRNNSERIHKENIMAPYNNHKGYKYITLFKNNKRTNYAIHRLVWISFNGPIPKHLQVNHIDEDKTNNHLDNINLLCCKANINYGSRNKKVSDFYRRKREHNCI